METRRSRKLLDFCAHGWLHQYLNSRQLMPSSLVNCGDWQHLNPESCWLTEDCWSNMSCPHLNSGTHFLKVTTVAFHHTLTHPVWKAAVLRLINNTVYIWISDKCLTAKTDPTLKPWRCDLCPHWNINDDRWCWSFQSGNSSLTNLLQLWCRSILRPWWSSVFAMCKWGLADITPNGTHPAVVLSVRDRCLNHWSQAFESHLILN